MDFQPLRSSSSSGSSKMNFFIINAETPIKQTVRSNPPAPIANAVRSPVAVTPSVLDELEDEVDSSVVVCALTSVSETKQRMNQD